MSNKTLNKANLEKLGADKLARLVMELVQGSAALQRRARLELSAAQGPKDVAADLRKRFASLRRASSYLDARKQRALVKDMDSLLGMITTTIAPHDPAEAFELTWSFVQLAPRVHERTDDSNGAVGDVFRRAVRVIADLSAKVTLTPEMLAERILDAVADAGYGEFDGIIPATVDALGPAGLEHLKRITTDWANAAPTPAEIAACQRYGLPLSPANAIARAKQSTASSILADVADAQGDVDAYMARYSPEQLTYATIAPDVARRLLSAGRVTQAHEIAQRALAREAGAKFHRTSVDLDEVYEECLAALGKRDALKAHLWARFEKHLNARALRKYLRLLPDFDDLEAEERAFDIATHHTDLRGALHLFLDWPAPDRAARLVLARAAELDGNDYMLLTKAAEALSDRHPLAATVIRRAMIDDTLKGAKSTRYRHAARHLVECHLADLSIIDYGAVQSHAAYEAALRQTHGRKQGFWSHV
ncbi:DUF6880 family protein [Roseinatronobacter sp. NSM]|uniref:DUF6880 family protein n=1 Tax=Roseinatronobacter sp. NSM TaxID=3457785 RepID=UPI004035D59F